MNVVREINKINELELQLGLSGASWHDEYKDSAYVYVGGLNDGLTEGDVITIFSQFGEVMDCHLPRDKDTGKTKGFGFIMYEDQRSTVLAVDNLNGSKVIDKTLRVDHVKNYKQVKTKGEDGEWIEPEAQSLNAKPMMIDDGGNDSDSSASSGASIDPEDPMRDFLLEQRKEAKALKKSSSSSSKKIKGKGKEKEKHKNETPEEKRLRKAKKSEKKAKKLALKTRSSAAKGVAELLGNLGGGRERERSRSRSPPRRERGRERRTSRSPRRRRSYSQERSPLPGRASGDRDHRR